jgi:predicted GNAT family acetyltransferase
MKAHTLRPGCQKELSTSKRRHGGKTSSLSKSELYRIKVDFSLTAVLHEQCVAEDFLHSINGRIWVQDENGKRDRSVGYINATLVQFGGAVDQDVNALSLGDGITGTVADYWEQLFDVETGHWKKELQEEFEALGLDLLIIDCIEIDREFRGRGLGIDCLNRTIDVFGPSCGFAVCKPWPLQFTPAFSSNRSSLRKLQAPDINESDAVRKLRLHWSKAGFWPFRETGIYIVSMAQRQPQGLRSARYTSIG